MFSDAIVGWAGAQEKNVPDLIARYDVQFDVPLRHRYAIGVLRMVEAFSPRWPASVRVGAYWCAIVQADVEYDLLEGLRLVSLSRGMSERLAQECATGSVDPADTFPPYVAARWLDGAGKILYRLGSFARARMSFEAAREIAARHHLWWCLPDIESNFIRARFEEMKQTYGGVFTENGLADLVEELQDVKARLVQELPSPSASNEGNAEGRDEEYLRGHSSVLHNLAVAHRELGNVADSLAASRESLAISVRLRDAYRIGQSLNHQARCEPDKAVQLYEQLEKGEWRRGQLIARQNLARLRGGIEGVTMLRDLIAVLGDDSGDSAIAGIDIDLRNYSCQFFDELVRNLASTLGRTDPNQYRALLEEAGTQRLDMARTVRRVVATPAYKRAYATAVRPNFLERVANLLADDTPDSNKLESTFALTEEASARELLDLLSNMNLPRLGRPPRLAQAVERPAASRPAHVSPPPSQPQPAGIRARRLPLRRAGLRDASSEEEAAVRATLAARETEFETQFLHRPLESAPHDPEITHRVRMFTVNNPGTCIVRYFTYGPGRAAHLGAFVFHGGTLGCVKGIPYEEVRAFAQGLDIHNPPTKEESERIWRLLLAPVWDMINASGQLSHLVIIPVDELFSLPLHTASPPGANTLPLAAMVPMSQSVSATAFVGRGRHLLKRQPVGPDDDLAAIIVADPGQPSVDQNEQGYEDPVFGDELVGTGWPAERLLIAGDRPPRLNGHVRLHQADWSGIAAITEARPEFFVYAGHGRYHRSFGQLGPSLELGGDDVLTQYDVALRLRLPRNKLSIVGACLAGQAQHTGGGDVVGFLRTFIAAGAGAVCIPLWSVLNSAMVETGRTVLAASRAAVSTSSRTFDVVQVLHDTYRDVAREHGDDFETMVEHMPLSLYL
ncbi:CHAT domain-containing protein [Streptomyces sp. NPDC005931]|uniref:CHAT domain-containing protein n=1 Tax=Streptomyces sp. NPDC005931 TaxID=3364737 RepID=UPI00367C581F